MIKLCNIVKNQVLFLRYVELWIPFDMNCAILQLSVLGKKSFVCSFEYIFHARIFKASEEVEVLENGQRR